MQGRTGLPPIGNYETVTIGLNGSISCRVWHEVHNPSSKVMSIRLLSNPAMKSGWHEREKAGEILEFDSLQELKTELIFCYLSWSAILDWRLRSSLVGGLAVVFEAEPVLVGQPFGALVVEHDVGVPVRGMLIPRVPASTFLELPA